MDSYEEECKAMLHLTYVNVRNICEIWKQIFEPDDCKENLRKLTEHANNYYSGLVKESIEQKERILQEIDNMKTEAKDLERLLHVKVKLPSYELGNGVTLSAVHYEIDNILVNFREELRMRKEEISELLLQQESLCKELGESPRVLLTDPLPTVDEMNEFAKHLVALRTEKDERINRIIEIREEIRNCLHVLDFEISSDTEDKLLNDRNISIDKETLESLNAMRSRYASQVHELVDTIDSMRNKLETLWNRLQISPNTRNKFKRLPKYGKATCNAILDELQRCNQIKRDNIKLFVQQYRDEMRVLWDKCLKSEKERERFSNYTCTTYTEDLLFLHEMEVNDLKLHYEAYKHIYELYEKRNVLWNRMLALEAKASEKDRFKNRGGELLQEERERKLIATKLPKMEQQITAFVKDYEEKEHRPFLVYGENIIDAMAHQWEKKRAEKEKAQSARKNAAISSAVKTQSIRTPISLRNATSMTSLRKTPSTISLSSHIVSASKRKLHPTDAIKPRAKKSLMPDLNSPSLFPKPSTSKTCLTPGSTNKSAKFKSGLKKPKPVIGSIIRRRSGRQSGTTKQKRKSINKSNSDIKNVPKVVIEDYGTSDGYITEQDGDDNYDSFQKNIEPALRSSVMYDTSFSSTLSKVSRMQKVVTDENVRVVNLPRRSKVETQPKRKLYSSSSHLSPHAINRTSHNNSHLPATTGRKLKTKNLPIII